MIKKKHLKMILDSIPKHPKPKIELEQYTIDGDLAAEILFFAQKDFLNNVVIDFGCGTGRLGIGAKLLGAKKVLGFDIDEECIKIANEYAKKLNLDNIKFYCEDIKNINKDIIYNLLDEDKNLKKIIIQNPPFGAQKKGADRLFIDKALEVGDIIYTIHNYPTKDFVINYIKDKGGKITHICETFFKIPASYEFHKKKLVKVPIIILRVEK